VYAQNGRLCGSGVVTGEDSELAIAVRGRIAVLCHVPFISFHAARRISRLAIPVAISAQALLRLPTLPSHRGRHRKRMPRVRVLIRPRAIVLLRPQAFRRELPCAANCIAWVV